MMYPWVHNETFLHSLIFPDWSTDREQTWSNNYQQTCNFLTHQTLFLLSKKTHKSFDNPSYGKKLYTLRHFVHYILAHRFKSTRHFILSRTRTIIFSGSLILNCHPSKTAWTKSCVQRNTNMDLISCFLKKSLKFPKNW